MSAKNPPASASVHPSVSQPTHAEILALRSALVAILHCLDDDLRLRRTPEGLLELKLRSHFPAPSHRGTLLRLGSAEDLLHWAHQTVRRPVVGQPEPTQAPATPQKKTRHKAGQSKPHGFEEKQGRGRVNGEG